MPIEYNLYIIYVTHLIWGTEFYAFSVLHVFKKSIVSNLGTKIEKCFFFKCRFTSNYHSSHLCIDILSKWQSVVQRRHKTVSYIHLLIANKSIYETKKKSLSNDMKFNYQAQKCQIVENT